jgi:plastocyanin
MNFKNPLLLIIILVGIGAVIFGLMSLNSKDSSDSTPNGTNSTQNEIETSPDSMSPPTEPPPGGSDLTQPTPDSTVNPDVDPIPTSSPTPVENETVTIEVEGDEFSFSPSTIRVASGSTVELMFKNIGNAPHNYAIDELGVLTRTIGGGESDLVTFTAPEAPTTITYTSYCTIPGHREGGMESTLIVE